MKRERMTVDDYLRVPIDPAWKVEYISGVAIWSPRHALVTLTAPIVRAERSAPCEIRELREEDRKRLTAAYQTTFAKTIDFCDCTPEQVSKITARGIHKAYAEEARIRSASLVAVLDDGSVVGAALFLQGDECPHLDALFVVPEWQRRGVATAMFFSAMRSLFDAGESTVSSYHDIGNVESAAWHNAVGFTEMPDEYIARLRKQAKRHSAYREAQLQVLDTADCINEPNYINEPN